MPDREALTVLIPTRLLIAAEAFAPGLSASAVAEAIGRGVTRAGAPAPDLCPIDLAEDRTEGPRELLDSAGFDGRMRSARAVVVAAAILQERALAGSLIFEVATRARQGGVPAYAVAAESALNPFDARMLDLQAILAAGDRRALIAAGGKLAKLV
jgi:glycerate kinase